jgi:membrane protein required for colicin V production
LTLFDIIALSILGVSALVGFVRGAVREVATVVAFVLAAFAAVFALRFIGPLARGALHPPWLGNITALLVVFLVVYITLRVLGSGLTRSLHNTRGLGMLDRLLGGGLGLVRGLIVLGLISLAIHLAPSPNGVPGWISSARLYPLSEKCAGFVRAFAPRGSALAHRLTPEIEKAVISGEGDRTDSSAVGHSDESGYARAARKGLDDVAEKTR